MKKITSKLLCIPPFISTAWENIKSLHFSTDTDTPSLVVTLSSGSEIKIPNLPAETLEDIFKTHTEYLESSSAQDKPTTPKPSRVEPKEGAEKVPFFSFDLPFNFDNLGDMGTLMNCTQHDMKLSDSEPLPPEIMDKVIKMASSMGLDISKLDHLKAEPHCNCPHCQVVRSVKASHEAGPDAPDLDEEVTESDLTFKEWDIKEVGEKLYEVANPLDSTEKYQVFLGNPVGCTCGKPHCAHLKAVLES